MNARDYKEMGREAYRRGRVIIPGSTPARFWQRRAFVAGYMEERNAWRAHNPGADEFGEMRERNAAWCKGMMATPKTDGE